MAQTSVQSSDALYFEDLIFSIASYSTTLTDDSLSDVSGASWTNVGAVTEFSREGAIETSQPPAMNVEHEQQITKSAENLNVTIQELNMTNYNILNGSQAQAVTVSGTSTSASDTYAAAVLSANKFVKFKEQSWSSTSATIPIVPTDIIVGGSSTYTTPGDYETLQDSNNFWGLMFTSTGAFSSTQSFTIAYDLVPKAQTQLWYGGADELTPFMVKVDAVMSDGRQITSYYPRVEYVSGGAVADKGNASGEFKDMAFSLQAREHPDYTYTSRKQFRIDVQSTG
jgi:hypothetical protein